LTKKPRTEKQPSPARVAGLTDDPSGPSVPFWLLCALILLLPFFPDEKLIRPKLLLFEAGLWTILSLWAGQQIARGRFFVRVPSLAVPVTGWMVFVAARAAFSANPPLALAELRRWLLCTGAFMACAQLLTDARRRGIFWRCWTVSTGIIAFYGILQHTGGWGMILVPRSVRVMGTFGNPIFFGVYLAASLPLLLWNIESETRPAFRRLSGLSFVLSLLALYWTQTRAAWIAAAAALTVTAVFRRYRSKRFWPVVILLMMVLAGFAVKTRSVWSRDQAHILIWRDTLRLFWNHPLAGVGLGEFHVHFPSVAGADLKAKWPPEQFIVNYAHNEYLQIAAETGWVGLALFLSIFLLLLRNALRAPPSLRNGEYWALLGSLAAVLTQNCFSVDMRFSISAAYLFLILGAFASLNPEDNPPRVPAPSFPFLRRAQPDETPWPVPVRLGLLIALFYTAGLITFQKTGSGWQINLLGLYQKPVNTAASSGWRFLPEELKAGFLTRLIHPYAARYRQSRNVGFFDQKLLDPAKTISDLEALSARFPDQASVFEKLGFAYAKEIRSKDAQGRDSLNRERVEQALQAYRKAADLAPLRPGPLNNLGNIYFTVGDKDRAMDFWRRAVRTDPGQIDPRLNLGKVLYMNGRLKESAEQFKEVLKLNPSNDEATIYLKRMVE